MKDILAGMTTSISELKKSPASILSEAEGAPVAILNRNKPAAYLVPVDTYEWMMEKLEDYELLKLARERAKDKAKAIEVNLDDL